MITREEMVKTLSSVSLSEASAVFVKHNVMIPRVIIDAALRYVLNAKIKVAKTLGLADELLYKMRYYLDFSVTQLEWLFLAVADSTSSTHYRTMLWDLILRNMDSLKLSNEFLAELLVLPTNRAEPFKEYNVILNKLAYDYHKCFDGKPIQTLINSYSKSATTTEIREIGQRYGIDIPKRLKKEEMLNIIIEELKNKDMYDDEIGEKLHGLPVLSLQRFAKDKGIKVSVDFKKDDLISYLFNGIKKANFQTYPSLKLDLDLADNFVFDLQDILTESQLAAEDKVHPTTNDTAVQPEPAVVKTVEVPVSMPTQIVSNIDTEELANIFTGAMREFVEELKLLLTKEVNVKVDIPEPKVEVVAPIAKPVFEVESKTDSQPTGEVEDSKSSQDAEIPVYPYDNFVNQINPNYDNELAEIVHKADLLKINPELAKKDMALELTEDGQEKPRKKTRKELKAEKQAEQKRLDDLQRAIATGDTSNIDLEYFDRQMRIKQYKLNVEDTKRRQKEKKRRRIGTIIRTIFLLIALVAVAYLVIAVVMGFQAPGTGLEVTLGGMYDLFAPITEAIRGFLNK